MFSYPKTARLLRRYQYQQLSKFAKQTVGRYIIVEKWHIHSGMDLGPKLGITVSRQFGKSHLRNRFKRVIRESFRLIYQDLSQELYINIRPRSFALYASSENIRKEFIQLLKMPSIVMKDVPECSSLSV